jgi:hypothetical protein
MNVSISEGLKALLGAVTQKLGSIRWHDAGELVSGRVEGSSDLSLLKDVSSQVEGLVEWMVRVVRTEVP